MSDSQLLNAEQAAAYHGVAKQTLHNWRSSGRYRVPCLRVGRLVRYRKTDLDRWLEGRAQTHTGEALER